MHGNSMPGTPGSQHGYPLGEPLYPYPMRPDLDPRRLSHSSHHSARSAASYNSRHSGHARHSGGYADDDLYDSALDSEEEERRRQLKKERHRKRKEEERNKREKARPTLGDSMYALFDGLKSAMGSDRKKV